MAEISRKGPALTAPAPLTERHDCSAFDCGNAALNDWLRQKALRNEGRSARSYVVASENMVAGYYAIATGAVIARQAPGAIRRNMPDPIPVMVLGRLAVDRAFQGQGVGAALLKDALQRILGVSQTAGLRAVLVHAIDDDAAAFYAGFGFKPSPADARTLFLSISEIAAAMG